MAYGKLILEEWMSLDGYVADKNDGIGFFTHLTPEAKYLFGNDQLKFLKNGRQILLAAKPRAVRRFLADATPDKEVIADMLNEIRSSSYLHDYQGTLGQLAGCRHIRPRHIEAIKSLKNSR